VYVLEAVTGRELWSKELTNPVYGIGGDNTVVVVPTSDDLTAFEPATGAVRWTRPLKCEDDVLVGAGLIHLDQQYDNGMVTLRTDDGADVWKRDDSASTRRLSADGRTLYLHGPTKHIRALTAPTGRETWVAEMHGDEVASNTGGSDDTSLLNAEVCVTRIDKIVYAVRRADGAAAWTFQSDRAVAGGVVSVGSLVYVPTLDGRVQAVRRATS
jgi:outer membrane protein assembly factor BamB